MGRLKPGVTREQALAELQPAFADTVRESWAARPPDTPNPTRSELPQLRVRPGAQGPDGPRLDAQQTLSAVFAVVAAILLIGCVNLATLLLVRASARRQEVARAPDPRREPLAGGSAVDDRNPPPRHARRDRRRHPRLVGEGFHAVAPSTGDSHRGCAHRSAGARIHGCAVGDHRGAVWDRTGAASDADRPWTVAENQRAQGRRHPRGCGARRFSQRRSPSASCSSSAPGSWCALSTISARSMSGSTPTTCWCFGLIRPCRVTVRLASLIYTSGSVRQSRPFPAFSLRRCL